MGRLILVAIILGAAAFAWRAIRRRQRRIVEALKRTDAEVKTSRTETLVKDPATGVYRPIDRGE